MIKRLWCGLWGHRWSQWVAGGPASPVSIDWYVRQCLRCGRLERVDQT